MEFFENQKNDTPVENKTEAPTEQTVSEKENALKDIKALQAIEAEQWDYLPKPIAARKRANKFLVMFLITLVLFVALFLSVANFIFGNGWIATRFGEGTKGIEFTIPIAETPELEDSDKYYQPDGRYTVQGVAKALSPSIVTIETYAEGYAFSPMGQGSGFIMTEDGYIITNAHVISEDSFSIIVRLSTGIEYSAELIGSDVKSDIAVIKINAKEKLTPVQFGDSDALELGEPVVTFGTPAGLEQTVTSGCVSGLDRMIKVDEENLEMSCIQIDAAINPGNSGGALLNMWGQVVGITSSKLDSLSYDGIGFAIEMSAAKPIIEQLIENGYISRPKIGIEFYQIDEAAAEYYETIPGLHIAGIDKTCDIANTDLRVDDVITHMNGVPVMSTDDVFAAISGLEAGDTVKATVKRLNFKGEFETFEIEFKLMPSDSSIKPSDDIVPEAEEEEK